MQQLDEISDIELLRMLKAGDSGSLPELFSRYYNDLIAGARRFTSDEDAIRDCLLDVFASLRDPNKPITFDPEKGHLFPYLLVAVRNRLLDLYRKRAKEPYVEDLGTLERLEQLVSAEYMEQNSGLDIWENIITIIPTSDLEIKLIDAIRTLSPIQRRIFLLRHLYGYKTSEIAEKFRMPSSKVSELLYAVRTRLKGALKADQQET